jgi:integrase
MRKKYNVSLPSGEKVWITGNTISEAFQNGLMKYGNLLAQETQKSHTMTVETFINTKYKPSFFPALKPKTRENYEQYLKLNVIPFLGKYALDEVKVDTIQQFFNWMATAGERGRKKNLNEKTIERVRGFTSRIFRIAKEMGLIEDTPFKHTLLRIHAEAGGHHNALTDEKVFEIKQNIPLLEDEEERLFMTLLVFMGMRPEEVYGLRWEDLRLEENYGFVRRVVVYPEHSKPYIDTTKTEASNRTILITSKPKAILAEVQKDSGFILGGEKPWCYSRTQRVKRRAFEKLGIKGFTPYDFRTTFATQAKESGQTSAQVADLLGHKDTRMVERIYARTRHHSVMKQLEAIERLNG